ncbi:unnamed protein product [Cuscuta europaea]|uniref:GDSL esterase/lipase At5g03610-like n=1 Tax=Cuscuta europaea TaxID=41803 RepID=A0A9P0ZEL1_CUSEU|nr:unnamed protein product [Cuscuta europaea]
MELKARLCSAFFFLFLCLLTLFPEVYNGERIEVSSSPTKLFVFGDSYADTGNNPYSAVCWNEPYGVTFPGRPSGRFSNGRVLTDFIARYMGIKSPVPYRRWKLGGTNLHKNGLNFAFGGTGVFTTLFDGPTMTTQINDFQQLIERHVYTKHELTNSFAHVSVAGNDYTTFDLNDDPQKNLIAFTQSVISQLVLNLKRIYELGVGRISVIAVPPFGCFPTVTSYKVCNDSLNSVSTFHNYLLKKAVEKLNNEIAADRSTYVILDLYFAFMSAFNVQDNRPGIQRFENPLVECCRGTTNESSCGVVGEDGTDEYIVCKNPKRSFFWDQKHPTQAGWLYVFSNLTSSLNTLLFPHGPMSYAAI